MERTLKENANLKRHNAVTFIMKSNPVLILFMVDMPSAIECVCILCLHLYAADLVVCGGVRLFPAFKSNCLPTHERLTGNEARV